MKTIVVPILSARCGIVPVAVALFSHVLMTGCTTHRTSTPGMVSAIAAYSGGTSAAKWGNVAVVPLNGQVRISTNRPASRTQMAADQLAFSGDEGNKLIPAILCFPHPAVWVLSSGIVLGGSTAVATGKSAYALMAGESQRDIDQAAVQIDQTAAEIRYAQCLTQRVCEGLQRRLPPAAKIDILTSDQVRARHASYRADPYEAQRQPHSRYEAEIDYRGLAYAGFDTVLELKVLEPELAGGDIGQVRCYVSMDVRARLIRTCDGSELAYSYLRYRSPKQRYTSWGSDQASSLRSEIDRSLGYFADEILGNGQTPSTNPTPFPAQTNYASLFTPTIDATVQSRIRETLALAYNPPQTKVVRKQP